MSEQKKWLINKYLFDSHKRTLTFNNASVLLEPKAAALLTYLCINPHKAISRDELIDAVWQGKVVSDNAINRVVVLLRKALMDDAKEKHIIATVPQVGYQMIAEISVVDDNEVKKLRLKRFGWGFVGLLIITLATTLYWQTGEQTNPKSLKQSPLLRKTGIQFDGAISVLDHLAFTSRKGSSVSVEVKFSNQPSSKIISQGYSSASFPVWSHDGRFLLFMGRSKEGCYILKANLVDNQLTKPQPIYACEQKQIISISLDSNNKWVYLAARNSRYSPNQVFAFNLENGAHISVKQPTAKGMGHHHLDASVLTSGKVLMVSDELPGKSSLYQLDVTNGSFKLLKQMPFHVTSASWTHKEKGFIHASRHPAYELMITPISGQSHSLLTDSRRVSLPKRHANGIDYIYTSYLNNRDIFVKGQQPTFNSSVMDYLPAISNDNSRLAFVSKRSGYSEIWVYDFAKDNLSNLQSPDKGRAFYDIKWSWNDRYLLANTDSGLLLFDLQLGISTKAWQTTELVYAINWLSDSSFNYSVFDNNHWRVWQQAINEDTRSANLADKGMIISDASRRITFDSQLNLELKEANTQSCRNNLFRRRATWTLYAGELYCVSAQTGQVIGVTQSASLDSEQIISPAETYQWSSHGLMHSEMLETNSDLMQITREKR